MQARLCNDVFDRSIKDYHVKDDVDQPLINPYPEKSLEALLYGKNWIDTVQWHLEDLIRSPNIAPSQLVALKRRIDASNQDRTDTVEKIDDYFLALFASAKPLPTARMNSETPAWLIDRMSILALKIFHMFEQTVRKDVDDGHRIKCGQKLAILEEQRVDMTRCLDELMEDMQAGRRFMKVYRQMKMYNDASLNPVLYSENQKT